MKRRRLRNEKPRPATTDVDDWPASLRNEHLARLGQTEKAGDTKGRPKGGSPFFIGEACVTKDHDYWQGSK